MKKIALAASLVAALAAVASIAGTDDVGTDMLICRAEPRADALPVLRLTSNTSLTVRNTQNGWSLIEAHGASCWINFQFLFAPPPLPTPPLAAPQPAPPQTTPMPFRQPAPRTAPARSYGGSSCPCSGRQVCIGPRGGRYCITSGGKKRYGV